MGRFLEITVKGWPPCRCFDGHVKLVGWLVVSRIYVALAVFQPYRDLEAGDNQSLKFKWRGGESNPGPLAPQAKGVTTRPPPIYTTGMLKNPTKCLWRWEPDCRSNFFSPPAHLCAVTYITEISLHATSSN